METSLPSRSRQNVYLELAVSISYTGSEEQLCAPVAESGETEVALS